MRFVPILAFAVFCPVSALAQDFGGDAIEGGVTRALQEDGRFDRFMQIVTAAELGRTVELGRTIFAPVDGAFDGLPADLAGMAERDLLGRIVRLHLVNEGPFRSTGLPQSAPSDLGVDLSFGVGTVAVTGGGTSASIVDADLAAGLATVHAIDDVLLTDEMQDRIAALSQPAPEPRADTEAAGTIPAPADPTDPDAMTDPAGVADEAADPIARSEAQTEAPSLAEDIAASDSGPTEGILPDTAPDDAPPPAPATGDPVGDIPIGEDGLPGRVIALPGPDDTAPPREAMRSVLSLFGRPVLDIDGARLGEISDVEVDIEAQETVVVIAMPGGALRRERLAALTLDTQAGALRLTEEDAANGR